MNSRHANNEMINTNSNNNAIANTKSNNNSKGIKTMNAVKTIARAACAALFFALAATASRPAQADVVVDRFVGPQETYGVAAGTTAMQLKVRNTDGYTVSGVNIQTYLYLPIDLIGGWTVRAMPKSGAFALAPYESRWITITIPATSLQGFSLRNQRMYAKALIGSHTYWLNNFLNVPAAAKVQSTQIKATGTSNGAIVFTVRFTNNGYVASTAQTAKVSTWKYGDGRVGTIVTQTATVKALQVGESVTLTFTSQPTEGYDIDGTVQVGTGDTVNFAF